MPIAIVIKRLARYVKPASWSELNNCVMFGKNNLLVLDQLSSNFVSLVQRKFNEQNRL